MLTTALIFVLRALATALLVIAVARIAERAGPFVASTVMTLPLYAGPGYYFLLGEVPPAFIGDSALVAFAGTGAVLTFATGYCLAVVRFGLPLTLALATLSWLALALPAQLTPMNLPLAAAFVTAGALLSRLAARQHDLHRQSAGQRARWLPLLARASIAGIAVATVALAGPMLGPSLTGLAVAFPLVLIVSIWTVHRQYGALFSAAVMSASRRTLTSYGSFCLTLALLAPRLQVELAFAIAVGVSVFSASSFAAFGIRARRAG